MAFLHLDATYEEFVRDERCLKIKPVLYIFACLEVYSFCIVQSSQMLSTTVPLKNSAPCFVFLVYEHAVRAEFFFRSNCFQ